jgi:NAD(P)H:quinone oxidoreductase type IV
MIIYVVFFSVNGHIYKLAEAVAEGARSVDGATVKVFQTANLIRNDAAEEKEAEETRKSFAHIPIIGAPDLANADAIVFGTPTKFGMMAIEMRNLLEQADPLRSPGSLVGKPGSVFTSTSTHHGGQDSTITSFHVALLHLGMIIVGVPYCDKRLLSVAAISGRSSYVPPPKDVSGGTIQPNDNEIGIARFQGQHVAEITRFLLLGKEVSAGRGLAFGDTVH